MYIYKIHIENFRAIKHLEWYPRKDTNIIIGPNGGGKTTLAVALNYLLNPYLQWYNRTLPEMDYYDRNINNPILIEVWFKQVENFIEEDGELFFEHVDENGKISEYGKELVLITRFKADNDRKASHMIVANGREHFFKQSHKGAINFKYIQAERDPLKELSFMNNSVLSKIIQNEKLSDLLQNIIGDFNDNSSKVLMGDPFFKSAIKTLEDSFARFDLVPSDKMSIGIEATELTEYKTLGAFSLVTKGKEDLNNYIPIKYESRGIKNLMLLLSIKESIEESEILVLEEPEQNLEPAMQRKIMRSILNQNKGQTFFITHSPEILKMFEFEKIFVMQEAKITTLPSINNKFEKHLEKHAKHQLLSGLFSKCVLLVEGDTEESGIPIFSEHWDDTIDDCGVQIIKCVGKGNIPKYADFYNKIGIPNISLLDNDKDLKDLLKKHYIQKNNSLVIVVPKDYEDSIIQLPIFQKYWKELFASRYQFNKEFYLRPFIEDKKSKSTKLKDLYALNSKINQINSLSELEKLLDREMLLEYQHEFLHMFMAGIVEARYVLYFLIERGGDEKENYVPKSYRNLFKLIRNYTNNNQKCNEYKNCVINQPLLDNEDWCNKCASERIDFDNVLQLKGVEQ